MMISTKGRYALRVMLELAAHEPEKYVPLKEIAKAQGISEKYLEAIIKILVTDDMVIGLRGKGGGYRLSRKPSEYTFSSILRLTEGTLAPVACLKGKSTDCARADQCLTLPMWRNLDRLIDNYLGSITLQDLITRSVVDPEDDCCGLTL